MNEIENFGKNVSEGNVTNPIVKGFYPDPSVCFAEGKYYMVCSSMQYFPGVPLFESEDLVNWKQIGHVLTRSSQIDLENVNSSGGVFAPTIRYNDGVFYMVTTNDSYHKNFYVTTKDIYGEWSEPVFVDQAGIDPSLLFEDGKCYFMSNGSDEDNNGCIFQCEINPETGEKLSESRPMWKGSGGRYLESPHLYHIGEYYYVMAAEGGTEYGHMITYARGKSPYGPFENYPENPVITNRNLGGHQSRIQGIGHGDLIMGPDGEYYIICLGFRQLATWVPYRHLGREVFITPVKFGEEGWFTVATPCFNNSHVMRARVEIPACKKQEKTDYSVSLESLYENPVRLTYLRKPELSNYGFVKDENGKVSFCIKQTAVTLNETISPSFAGVRQSEFETELRAEVEAADGEAGVTVYMDENSHFDVFLSADKNSGARHVSLRICEGDLKTVVRTEPIEKGPAHIGFRSTAYGYDFFMEKGGEEISLGGAQSKYLSSEVCGGFTGVFAAMYATNPSGESTWAEFTRFDWKQEDTYI